jgi:hypothetical protein
MIVYVTKDALKSGIYEKELYKVEGALAIIKERNVGNPWSYYTKPDWHWDLESAIEQFEYMKSKKILSLEKSIEKVRMQTHVLHRLPK